MQEQFTKTIHTHARNFKEHNRQSRVVEKCLLSGTRRLSNNMKLTNTPCYITDVIQNIAVTKVSNVWQKVV